MLNIPLFIADQTDRLIGMALAEKDDHSPCIGGHYKNENGKALHSWHNFSTLHKSYSFTNICTANTSVIRAIG